MLPGNAERWNAVAGLEHVINRFGRNLETAVQVDEERHLAGLHRRLYAFVRRLTRISETERTHQCIVDAIAREVRAQTAAFAAYNESEQALVISATRGYPVAIVDHVRIRPGDGVIGHAFVSARPEIVQVEDSSRRLRYRTNSYMLLPLVASGQCLGVIALTDREDGQATFTEKLAEWAPLSGEALIAAARDYLDHCEGSLHPGDDITLVVMEIERGRAAGSIASDVTIPEVTEPPSLRM